MKTSFLRRCAFCAVIALLSACAAYSGSGLKPGVDTIENVVAVMGAPAMRWDDPDGRVQLAYPRGPAGTQTFMVYIRPDKRLDRIEGVLDTLHFARIENEKSSQADVLRILGPSFPGWTAYFERRNELVWEWRFCNDWGQMARFDALFDATTGIVRTTYQRTEYRGPYGATMSCAH
ncbi:MAG: hypothetical protein LBL72_05930 [Candidatus Accumulibacter sp.]|jgi:hypothetical protein|nr:hypothetical protein [Accumulibacter sp.]